jgi:hypothetical protein
MKNLLFIILLFISINIAYSTDSEDWRLVGSKTIFKTDDADGFNIDSDGKWVPLNRLNKPFTEEFPEPLTGSTRKWRIVSKYSDSDSSINTSFQIRFMTNSFVRPTFSFVRPLGYQGVIETLSNWFQFEDGTNKRTYKGDAGIYARVIAPPTTKNTGKIYSIELEAWDVISSGDKSVAIASRSLPENTTNSSSLNSALKEISEEEARGFAVLVMETLIGKDEKEFNALLADKCYSLENGGIYYDKSLPHYANLKKDIKSTHITLANYKKEYKPTLIKYEEYSDLFPHWLEDGRDWKPSKSDFLLFANLPINGEFRQVVFMIGKSGGKWEIKAIPQ